MKNNWREIKKDPIIAEALMSVPLIELLSSEAKINSLK